MARIAGVDLPRTKRVEIGLTYIFGIGRHRSNEILTEAGVSGDIRVKDLSEDDVRKISRVIEEQGRRRRRPPEGDLAEHQAPDGDRLLPRHAAPPRPAGARPAHHAPTRARARARARAQLRRRRRCNTMAKTDATATPEKGAGKKTKKVFKKRGEKRIVHSGFAHIQASFNNTIVTITDTEGNVIAWSSAGGIGFKGSRKGTPFAATQAAINAANAAKQLGLRSVDVKVTGPARAASRPSARCRRSASR